MKIDYSGPFDVDFSGNRKLKHIKHSYGSSEKMNANGLKKTLAKTANSLEKLRLLVLIGDEARQIDNSEEYLDLPIMPKLTSLELLSANDPIVGRNLDDLTPKYLPNLNYLKLGNIGSIYCGNTELTILQDLVERESYKHSGVIKLSFSGVKNPLLLKDLKSWFPNLETFEVALIKTKGSFSEYQLANLFNVLKDVKLKILKIKIPYKYDTVDLVNALEPTYLQLFEGTLIN
jgi:hypothetical protein